MTFIMTHPKNRKIGHEKFRETRPIGSYKDNLGDSIIGWFWYLLSQSEDDKKVCYNCHK